MADFLAMFDLFLKETRFEQKRKNCLKATQQSLSMPASWLADSAADLGSLTGGFCGDSFVWSGGFCGDFLFGVADFAAIFCADLRWPRAVAFFFK